MFLFLQSEKIAFIMDESNVLDSSFLERMNTLLANGEVPGLFEGDEYTTLMTQCKEGSQRAGLMLDSSEELYKWFTQEVIFKCKHLKVLKFLRASILLTLFSSVTTLVVCSPICLFSQTGCTQIRLLTWGQPDQGSYCLLP